MAKSTKTTNISHLREAEEEAKIIIESTVSRLEKMGFGLVGYGEVKGTGIKIKQLLAIPASKLDDSH